MLYSAWKSHIITRSTVLVLPLQLWFPGYEVKKILILMGGWSIKISQKEPKVIQNDPYKLFGLKDLKHVTDKIKIVVF